jgi:hypothetical protein
MTKPKIVFDLSQQWPLFRQPGIYGYLVPQLNLIKILPDVYLLEWFIPGSLNRQTNLHLFKKVTKQELQKLFSNTPLNQLSLFDIFNPDDGDVHNNLRIGPINNNNYYKDAIFQLIDRNLIKDRLDAIVNEPLMSPNNVALISIHDIESMLQ